MISKALFQKAETFFFILTINLANSFKYIITHANSSRVSIAIIHICLRFCLCVCLSLLAYDKTKTAETKIVKLGIEIVNHDTSPIN